MTPWNESLVAEIHQHWWKSANLAAFLSLFSNEHPT